MLMNMFNDDERKIFNKEFNFGTPKEAEILSILEEYFGETFLEPENQFSAFDLYNDTTQIEIKSRRNNYRAYPTTLIGTNKAIKTDKKQLFVFNFLDGIYYIQYDEERFSFWIDNFTRNSRIGLETEANKYFYIPITELTLIKQK